MRTKWARGREKANKLLTVYGKKMNLLLYFSKDQRSLLKNHVSTYIQSFLIFFDTKLEPTEKVKMEATRAVYLESRFYKIESTFSERLWVVAPVRKDVLITS